MGLQYPARCVLRSSAVESSSVAGSERPDLALQPPPASETMANGLLEGLPHLIAVWAMERSPDTQANHDDGNPRGDVVVHGCSQTNSSAASEGRGEVFALCGNRSRRRH